jgi:hypothetical protein
MTPSDSPEHSDDETEIGEPREHESDDEFEFEEIESGLRRGDIEYKAKNFSAAELFFSRVCTMAKQLSLQRRNSLNLRDVQLKIAICFFHQEKFQEVEAAAVAVKEGPRILKDDKIRASAASHLIAEIFCQVQKFEKAQQECRNAVIERQKLLGKDNLSYLESLSLLSIIKESRGDPVGAAMDQDMIPADVTDPLLKERRERKIIVESPKHSERRDLLRTSGPKIGNVKDISPEDKAAGILAVTGSFSQSLKYNPREALFWACGHSSMAMVQLLLNGWSLEPPTELPISSGFAGRSFLVAEDIKSDRKAFGETPLHIAAKYGNKNIVEMLLDAGMDIESHDVIRRTPLHATLEFKAGDGEGVVRLLLEKGADIAAKNTIGYSPSIYRGSSESCIRFCHSILLQRNADTEWHQKARNFQLWLNVHQNSIDLAKLMLELGADPSWKGSTSDETTYEETSYEVAISKGLVEMTKLLREADRRRLLAAPSTKSSFFDELGRAPAIKPVAAPEELAITAAPGFKPVAVLERNTFGRI